MGDATIKQSKDLGPIAAKLNELQQMRFETERSFVILTEALSPALEGVPPTDEQPGPVEYDANDSELLHALELERVGLRELRDQIMRIHRRVQL